MEGGRSGKDGRGQDSLGSLRKCNQPPLRIRLNLCIDDMDILDGRGHGFARVWTVEHRIFLGFFRVFLGFFLGFF